MIEAYQKGKDLHRLTALLILGKEDISDEDRQLAKAVNFGLLSGMSAKGFRTYAKQTYAVDLKGEEAKAYRNRFFQAYPALARWHRDVKKRRDMESRTVVGRKRFLDAKCWDVMRLNSPVQGTGADGLKLALGLLWERRAECPGAAPVLVVHDEIVFQCREG